MMYVICAINHLPTGDETYVLVVCHDFAQAEHTVASLRAEDSPLEYFYQEVAAI